MAKGIIQYSKDIVNDSFASTETTYSSVKIEQLLSTLSSDMYKVNDKLSMKTVGGVQTINQSDLPITPTTQLKLNQIVYDTNKILGIISAIDTVSLTVDVTTIHSNEGEGGCEIILGCFDTPPTATSAGDMYYNTTNGLLYTADASLTWDVGSLPVEKITYLNLDDHKIYAFTNNQFEIYGGSEVEISSKIDNALTEIASGPEKGLYVKDLEAKLNQISSIQRVNIGNAPEYMLIYTRAGGTPSNRAVSQGTYNVTSWHNDLETNMDSSRYDVTSTNGYVILKKGITYELEFSTLSDSIGASYYIKNEAGQSIGNRGYMSANIGKWSDESIKGIYTPEKDEKITFEVTYPAQFAAKSASTTLSTTGSHYMDCSHIFIRQINPYVVDPVEHVNIDKGLEDTPVGHIMSTAGGTTPPHYLPCNGAEYNIADYPYLSEYFKTELGSYNCFGGDGITTFAVPNIKNTEKLDTTSISGNAWASSIYSSNYLAAKAFNGIIDVNNNYWQTVAYPTFPVEIGIDLENGYAVKKYVLHNYGWSAGAIDDRPTSWTFEGSINKTDWDILDTQTNYVWTTGKEGFNIPNVRPYRYYRFIITATIGGQKSPVLNQVELFVNTENPSHIKYEPTYFLNVGDVTYEYGCEKIMGIFNTPPTPAGLESKYYNSNDGKIYTSEDGVTWNLGEYPLDSILYINVSDKEIYMYDGTDLVSIGGKGIAQVSNKVGNAVENISGSADPLEDGLYVEDLQPQIDSIKKYQKYLNTELDYCYARLSTSIPKTTINVQDIIPFEKVSGNLEMNNNAIKLPAGKTYELDADLRIVDGETIFAFYDKTNNKSLGQFTETISTENGTEVSGKVIVTPDTDIEVSIKCVYKYSEGNPSLTAGSASYNYCYFIAKEINRQIVIDPVNYIDTTQGIQDTPVGTIINVMGNTTPKHYLPCDGSIYNIVDYPYLAEHFKTEFGKYNIFGGNGVTTFAAPNLEESTMVDPGLITDYATDGVAFTNLDNYSGYNYKNVFNYANTNTWFSDTSPDELSLSNKPHIGYKFNSPKCVKKMLLTNMQYNGVWRCIDYDIESSLDGANWVNLYSGTLPGDSNEYEITLSNSSFYTYYRLVFTSILPEGTDYNWGIGKIKFLGYDTDSNKVIKYEPTYFIDTITGYEQVDELLDTPVELDAPNKADLLKIPVATVSGVIYDIEYATKPLMGQVVQLNNNIDNYDEIEIVAYGLNNVNHERYDRVTLRIRKEDYITSDSPAFDDGSQDLNFFAVSTGIRFMQIRFNIRNDKSSLGLCQTTYYHGPAPDTAPTWDGVRIEKVRGINRKYKIS